MKTRMGAQSPEMDSLVEFPPCPKSKFFHSQEVLCDKVTWTVKVGLGKYNVKLYVGDPQAKQESTRSNRFANILYSKGCLCPLFYLSPAEPPHVRLSPWE